MLVQYDALHARINFKATQPNRSQVRRDAGVSASKKRATPESRLLRQAQLALYILRRRLPERGTQCTQLTANRTDRGSQKRNEKGKEGEGSFRNRQCARKGRVCGWGGRRLAWRLYIALGPGIDRCISKYDRSDLGRSGRKLANDAVARMRRSVRLTATRHFAGGSRDRIDDESGLEGSASN